ESASERRQLAALLACSLTRSRALWRRALDSLVAPRDPPPGTRGVGSRVLPRGAVYVGSTRVHASGANWRPYSRARRAVGAHAVPRTVATCTRFARRAARPAAVHSRRGV